MNWITLVLIIGVAVANILWNAGARGIVKTIYDIRSRVRAVWRVTWSTWPRKLVTTLPVAALVAMESASPGWVEAQISRLPDILWLLTGTAHSVGMLAIVPVLIGWLVAGLRPVVKWVGPSR